MLSIALPVVAPFEDICDLGTRSCRGVVIAKTSKTARPVNAAFSPVLSPLRGSPLQPAVMSRLVIQTLLRLGVDIAGIGAENFRGGGGLRLDQIIADDLCQRIEFVGPLEQGD